MKIKYMFLTMAAALLAGCSEDLDRGNAYNPEKGLTATIPTYPFEDGTRVNISEDLQTFTWSDGDKLGLYYQGSNSTAHAAFSIINGGGSTGNFENEAFILKSSSTYYAFYPFNESATIASAPVDFTGQVQNGNGSAAHLGAYNYMYSTVNTDASGNASIQFKNLGSVMQLQLTVSNSATYTGIDITSNGTEFITKGTASMIDGSIIATNTSASIHLDFQNGITLNAGDVLTANILVAPVDMSGSTLTIALINVDNDEFEVTTEGKNMFQGKAYLYEETVPYTDVDEIPYVTFTADAEQTLQMSQAVSTLEYSVNGANWTELGTAQVTFGNSYGNLRLRGKSSVGTNGAIISFGNATKVACSGDIRTLIDYENYTTTDTGNATFKKLFYNCTSLTQAPELPATDLADYCYSYMFKGCKSLTQAPELPATTLADGCYDSMFYDCTSLTQAPQLPATNLARGCYDFMFSGCTSLTQAPELPATDLADWCYSYMFWRCKSLIQAPELTATTLTSKCYQFMFRDCTSLTQAPELPATTLADGCYVNMFDGCTSLAQAPELPATTLAYNCYSEMFRGCTSLTQAPSILPATNLTQECYHRMFLGCTSLTQAPGLPATNLADYCYSGMFYNCTSLTQTPQLPATNLVGGCYYEMFRGCTSLIQGPRLPATQLDIYCYGSMFYGCTSLTQAPKLLATNLDGGCYDKMFYGCTSLVQGPVLPATTLADGCYEEMFSGCTSLIQAPVLPATTLEGSCYQGMFVGCCNLNYIKMMAIDIQNSSCLYNWVDGVSASGTFVKNKDATWEILYDFDADFYYIPEGWTIVKE